MKKIVVTFILVVGFILSVNSQFVNVDDQSAYCYEFAERGAEMEFADGREDYFTAYFEWYEICMEAHGEEIAYDFGTGGE